MNRALDLKFKESKSLSKTLVIFMSPGILGQYSILNRAADQTTVLLFPFNILV